MRVSVSEPHTGVIYSADTCDDYDHVEDVVYAFVNLLQAVGFARSSIEEALSIPHLELERRVLGRRV